jgi:hypothetical protein
MKGCEKVDVLLEVPLFDMVVDRNLSDNEGSGDHRVRRTDFQAGREVAEDSTKSGSGEAEGKIKSYELHFDEVVECLAGIGDVGLATDEMAAAKIIARAGFE